MRQIATLPVRFAAGDVDFPLMRASSRRFSVFLLALTAACGANFGDGVGLEDCDAGLSDDEIFELEALADGGVVDFQALCAENVPIGRDVDGGEGAFTDAEACAALVQKTCGDGALCAEDPGCVAATLQSRFEPEGCTDALGDARSFPACAQGTCDQLTQKVCGDDDTAGACEDSPGCEPARVLQRRVEDGDVSAEQSCASALADESIFPACQ